MFRPAALGIDVSKDTLVCTLVDAYSREKIWSDTYPNTPSGIKRLLQRTPDHACLALEPTGRYGQTVVRAAREMDRTVLLAQPKRTKAYLNSIQSRAKTDQIDSHGIALFALAHPLPDYPIKSSMIEQIDQLLSARKGLTKAISSLKLRVKELPYAAQALKESIEALETQCEQIDAQLRSLEKASRAHSTQTDEATAVNPDHVAFANAVRTLQQVPGIGLITASTVASRLTSRHFPGSDQFVAYCGLDIAVRQSGKSQGQGSLSKQGDSELRRLLFLAALATLRAKESPFKVQYQRELAKGLSTTAATCAISRKMARLCWSLVTKGQKYDSDRVHQQPKVHQEKIK